MFHLGTGKFPIWALELLHHLPRFLPGACALSLGGVWPLWGSRKGIKFPSVPRAFPVGHSAEVLAGCGGVSGGSSASSQSPDIHRGVLDLPGQRSRVCRLSARGFPAREGTWQLPSAELSVQTGVGPCLFSSQPQEAYVGKLSTADWLTPFHSLKARNCL